MSGNNDLQDLYRDLILDHARSPRNFGKLDDATHEAEGINPLCGDKLHLYLSVNDDERIVGAAFEGSGCAISTASASLLTETIDDIAVGDALRYFRAVTSRLTTDEAVDESGLDLDKLRALDGVREHPMRIKCATLAWHALNAALQNSKDPATTE